MIVEDNIILKSQDLLESVIDNEVVILGIKAGNYIGLNEMGTEIWSMISEPIKVSVLINTLSKLYDEKEQIIKEQVLDFLNNLKEKSFIKLVDET